MNRREAYIKRTKQVRKQKRVLAITFCVAFIITSLFISAKAYAGNSKCESDSVKKYKSVMIYSGDTVESIAAVYMTAEYSSVNKYINEVYSINGINNATVLVPGNHIIVPYYENIYDNSVVEFQLAFN